MIVRARDIYSITSPTILSGSAVMIVLKKRIKIAMV